MIYYFTERWPDCGLIPSIEIDLLYHNNLSRLRTECVGYPSRECECFNLPGRIYGCNPSTYDVHQHHFPLVIVSRSICVRCRNEQITRMDETLSWLGWVNQGERRLIWLRAEGVPWRLISYKTGFPKTSAQRYWQRALFVISRRLELIKVNTQG